MIDFPKDESLMVAGLDAWPFAKEACVPDWLVLEERLQARLNVKSFRLPPEHRDPSPGIHHANVDIPTVRFPQWHYCHRCGGMERIPLFGGRQRCAGRPYTGISCDAKPHKSRSFLIPVRIVAVCEKGHIEDFPFLQWIHRKRSATPNCTLRFRAGRSSSMLTGVRIECSCGESKTLAGVFDFDHKGLGALQRIGRTCSGSRPWLGMVEPIHATCGAPLRAVQRGATNVYFPYVVSSIYLPLWAEQAHRVIVDALSRPDIWDILTSGLIDGKRIDPARCDTIAKMWKLDAQNLLTVAQKKLDGLSVEPVRTEEEYRRQEYSALLAPRGGPDTELFVEITPQADLPPGLNKLFNSIGLVRKLRETRCMAGFTRLIPPDPDNPSGRMQSLKTDALIDWLPAVVVRGEGIFLEVNQDLLNDWVERTTAGQRTAQLANNYNERRINRRQPIRQVTPRFVFLHSLAHSLINQLSFDCGYGSASLRERIYCSVDENDEAMQGILIYTASGDAEGTMGGLVRQGQPDRLLQTLRAALDKARWCSSDPVCIEAQAQGTDNANLAACHGCLLISETSCEEGNRLLDRALLNGTPTEPDLGLLAGILDGSFS